MPAQQVSRRSVARGAAWSVPLVVVGVAAPAFAASAATPTAVPGASCKCPGSGGNNFNFKAVLAFTTPGNDSWMIHVLSWTFDNATVPTNPADTTLTGGEGNVVLMFNVTNSAAKHFVSVQYQATNLTTNQTYTLTFPNTELTFAPSCASPITCP
jgi:hypothetical protein